MKPLLFSITPELIERLQKGGRVRTFVDGEEIFAGGDDATVLPVVISGRVKMIHFLEPGKEVIVGIFNEGEMFAVPPVFDGGKYPATAIAMERTELLLIDRPAFLKLLRESSEFSFSVIGWMSEMLRDKTATIQNLATASPQHRVGHILLKLAERQESDGPVTITITRQDIARMAGIATETAIRAVRKLADKKLVTINHGKITVEATESLARFLES